MPSLPALAKPVLNKAALMLLPRSLRTKWKERNAFKFFERRWASGRGTLSNNHYQYFYTTYFGLPASYYDGKRVIDIGCGPRGSLEWAAGAKERVGLDPLVDEYRALGIDRHSMKYVDGAAERVPFGDGYFDIVTTFNSLDHVEDVTAAVWEIKRIVKPGGLVLLITEINHAPRITEPHTLSEDVLQSFEPELRVEKSDVIEFRSDHEIYRSLREARTYTGRKGGRPAILTAMLRKGSAGSLGCAG
jgi:2-polyprenyl-3-methyl-5-hydroxy-6-metoxy-1,4-benzoquinol methylase